MPLLGLINKSNIKSLPSISYHIISKITIKSIIHKIAITDLLVHLMIIFPLINPVFLIQQELFS